jgi:iron complex outermembrane recepter protein
VRYYISSLVLLLLCSFVSYTQVVITGKVVDAESKAGIEGVTIRVSKTIGATTDKNGFYKLDVSGHVVFSVEISHLSYTPISKKIDVNSLVNGELNFELVKSTRITSEVVVSAQIEKNVLEKIPARINIIDAEIIMTNTGNSAHSILMNTSGVNVTSTLGVFGNKTAVTLRGTNGNDQSRTLVLLDDIPINKSDGGGVNWNLINKESIEKVIVLKGPVSALYGSNAMGGIINFITKQPQQKIACNVNLGYGTFNTLFGSINLSGRVNVKNTNGLYWNLFSFARKSDGYITTPKEFIPENDSIIIKTNLSELNIGAKVGYAISKNNNIELSLGCFDDIRGNGIKVFEQYGANQQHDTYISRLKYNALLLDKINFNAFVFFQMERYDRLYEYMNEGEYKLYEANSDRIEKGGTLNASKCLFENNFETTLGVDFKQGSVNAKDTYFTSSDIIYNRGQMSIISTYVQNQMKFINDALTFSVGLRYDYAKFNKGLFLVETPSYSIDFISDFNERNIPEKKWSSWSPKISIDFKANRSTKFYISAGKGFGAPILDDMCRSGKRQNTFKIANPNLKPEKLYNAEMGFDVDFFSDFKYTFSAYYSIGKDFMYYVNTGDSVNMGYKISALQMRDNVGLVKIFGIESELRKSIYKSIDAFLNYSFNHSKIADYKSLTNTDIDLNNKFLVDLPKHKMTMGLICRFKSLSFSGNASYIGKRWINENNELEKQYLYRYTYPPYWLLGFKVRNTFLEKYSISLNVDNLTNKIFINDSGQQNPGRMLFVEVNINL